MGALSKRDSLRNVGSLLDNAPNYLDSKSALSKKELTVESD